MKDIFSLTMDILLAERGDVCAMRRVAHTLLYENGMKPLEGKQTRHCLRYLRAACAEGDTDAMLDLGGMYLLGRDIPKNERTALYWYAKAALAGNPLAYCRIGQFFLYDEAEDGQEYLPPTEDPERLQKAYCAFLSGALRGQAGCLVELGIMLMNGECGSPDEQGGFGCFLRAYRAPAAEREERADAALHLAKCFRFGEGTAKDLRRALRLARISWRLNSDEYAAGRVGTDCFVREAKETYEQIRAELNGAQQDGA